MRVLAFSDFAPPETNGGVERTLDEIYGRMSRKHRTVIDVVTLAGGGLAPREDHNGYSIHRAPRLPLERLTGMQIAVSPPIWKRGFERARQSRPDVIHAHTLFFHSSLVAASLARLLRIPLVLTVHLGSAGALPQPQQAAVGLYERTVGRSLLSSARRIICVSNDVATHVASIGASSDRITVIPNGVDTQRFRPADRASTARPVVVCVGRLIANKGQQHLLEAAEHLKCEGFSFELRFAGDGPQRQRLQEDAERRGLQGMVRFLGERHDISDILREADIFVRPSLTEGMSLAVLEAMATGLPPVVTAVSGSRELVEHGVSGLIVPPADSRAIAEALRTLFSDASLGPRLGGAARERAQQFSWDRVAEDTLEELMLAAA